MMKAHGFMKAGNSVMDSLYADNTAGFVTFIFDDTIGNHSDSILDVKPILKSMNIPYDSTYQNNVYNDVINAFEESADGEKFLAKAPPSFFCQTCRYRLRPAPPSAAPQSQLIADIAI